MLADLLDLVCRSLRRLWPGRAAAVLELQRAGRARGAARRSAGRRRGRYEGVVRTALLAYKERGRRDLRRPLATLLAAALTDVAARVQPSSRCRRRRAARRARGGDHVLRLATVAARRVGAGSGAHAAAAGAGRPRFGRPGHRRAGSEPGRGDGRAPAPARATAIVVDDIVTTGASLIEARGRSCCGLAGRGCRRRRRDPAPQTDVARRVAATSSRSIRSGLT